MAQHSYENFQQYYFLSENKLRKAYYAQNWPLNDWNVTYLCIVMYFMSCLSAPLKNSWEYLPMHIVNLWSAVTHRPGVWEAPSRAPPKNVTIGFNFPLRVNSILHACCKIFYSRQAGLIFIAKAAMSRNNSPSTSRACHHLLWAGLGVTH